MARRIDENLAGTVRTFVQQSSAGETAGR